MKKLNKIIFVLVVLLMLGALSTSMLSTGNSLNIIGEPRNWLVLVLAFFLILAVAASFKALDAMNYLLAKKEGRLPADSDEDYEESEAEEEDGLSIWHKLNDSTPVSEEEKIATDHEYDGIRELDNNLPPWWLAGFYLSIVFSVVYLLRYHVFQTAPLQEEEFQMEMAAAEVAKEEYLKTAANLIDENSVELLQEEERLLAGKAIYTKNCAVCHAADGGGGVGPNLTDSYWIHGNTINEVFSTIKYGVPSKGMIPWQDQLSPAETQEVASYVLSLQGSSPADPKEPQGELMENVPATENNDQTEPTDSVQTGDVEGDAMAGA